MMPGTNVRVQQRQQTAADLWHSQDGEWIRTTGVVWFGSVLARPAG